MKRKFTFLIAAAVMLLTMMASTATAWGQSDYSTDYTGNITLSTAGGSNASNCAVVIAETNYAGIKAGTSSKTGAVKITVPANTKYLHLHAAAWNNIPTALAVTPSGYSDNIDLTANSGISGNSPFTFSGDPSTDDYYKVITFANALAADTDLTFTATTGKRFVVWGVTSEEEGGGGETPSITANNVVIAYDATEGYIEYTINHPVTGGELTAEVTAGDWLENLLVEETVTFNCDPNQAATARTATVTLTYTYTAKETMTKDVTVTQAAVPMVYTTIPALFEDATSTATDVTITFDSWVISAVKNSNAYLTDNNGNGLIIYASDHGFQVNDVLTGTASCKLQLYRGSAELTVLTSSTEGLTVTNDGTVTEQNIAINNLGGVNTGSLLAYENLTYNGTALVDGDNNAITPYSTLYSYTFVNGKVYNVKGIYLQYNDTKELLPRSADDIEIVEAEVADPVFNPAAGTYATAQTVTMSCTTEGAAIHYTTDGTEPDGNSNVYTTGITVSEATTFKAKAIKGDDASTIVTATYHICSNENPYTVAQALAFLEYPANEVYVHGIVSTAPTAAPNNNGQLTYYISDNGEATNQLQVYKGLGLNEAAFTAQDDIQVGDIVTVYGNLVIYGTTNPIKEFAQGNYLTSFERPVEPSITVANATVNVGAEGGDGTLTVTYENITTVAADIWFCNAAGTEEATYDWITASINADNNVEYLVEENDSNERTAYFKVWAYADDATTEVYSNLVTVTQAEYVAPTYTVTYVANGGTGTMTDPNSPYVENDEVTLLANEFTAPEGMKWDAWLVEAANQTQIDVNEGKFNMPASDVTVTAQWVVDPDAPTYEWVLTALADLTSSDVFVIVGNNGSNYAMTNDNSTTSAPSASAVTIANDKLSNAPADNLKWNVEIGNNGYTFYPNGITNKWLYCTDANNGLRVGTGDYKVFAYEEVTTTNKEGYYLTITPASDKRYVCIYNNADWRSYKSGSIVKTDTKFYKRQVASTDPHLYTNDVNIESDATEGEITYTLENPIPTGILTAAITEGNEGNWLTLGTVGATVPFTCLANTDPTARTATVTLTYSYGETSITATAVVTQAKFVIDYAEMPFEFNEGKEAIESTNGLTQEYLGQDYSSSNTTKLKFDNKNNNSTLVLKLNAAPVSISYDIIGNNFSGSTFKVQVSANGTDYDDLAVYGELSSTIQTITLINNDDNVRYVKWIYYKSSGNVGLGNIHVTENYDTYGDVTINDLDLSSPSESLIIHEGSAVTINGTLTSGSPDNLIIEDGGQLVYEGGSFAATLKKDVTAASSWKDAVADGWYLIASPVDGASVSTATTGDYDFFAYDEANATWRNQKVSANNITTFDRGIGYLYANKEAKTIDYAGMMLSTKEQVTIPLSFAGSTSAKGANLVGNPFTRELVENDIELNGTEVTTYYTVAGGSELTALAIADAHIKPGQGFFVQATAESQNLVFNPTSSSKGSNNKGYISIVAGNDEFTDNAYVHVANGNTLRKMTLNDNSSIVYVMNDNKDFAAARIDALEGSMPVCFKANKLGQYTITIEAKDIKADYLHLIDNFTHEDIDLLLEPSYSFIASNNESASRFTLVFRAEGSTVEANDIFAYQNGNDIVVNGEGELQVFDIMGRLISTQHINGVQTINVSSNGVYIFKLNEKTQKIVVR